MTTLDKIRTEIDAARFIDKDTRLCKNANASGLEVALEIIDKYAEQEQKTGTWSVDIDHSRGWDWRRFYCSECGKWQVYGTPEFCPNCGARMSNES